MKKKEKKSKFSKGIVITCISLTILFTIAILYIFLKTSSEPTTLITAVFAFITTEMWNLKDIKKEKVKNENDN